MNHPIFITILLLFSLFNTKQEGMNGQYKMEYEQEYSAQNGIITFKMDAYVRKPSKGKALKGTIEYTTRDVILTDNKNNLQIRFFKMDIAKDTIYFKTKDLKNQPNSSNGDIMIYSGKLIKIG